MHGDLFDQFTKLITNIFLFLFKKAISLAVRISSASENHVSRYSSDKEALFKEPKYIQYLLYLFLSKNDREIVIGDLVEDYRKIYHKSDKEKADKWLYEEMVVSLQRLIFRRAILYHAWAFIRKPFGRHSLNSKLQNIKSKFGYSFAVYGEQLHRQRLIITSTVLTTLFALILAPIWISLKEPSALSVVKDGTFYLGPLKEISSNNHPELKRPEPSQVSVLPKPRSVSPRKATQNTRPSEPASVALMVINLVRNGLTEKKVIEVPNTRVRFLITLTNGSDKGLYEVSLRDAFTTPLATRLTRSPNGKSLSIVLDMRSVPPQKSYYIFVSREDGVPEYWPIVVVNSK